MKLHMVTGTYHGTEVTVSDKKPPNVWSCYTGDVDSELGKLSVHYRLAFWDADNAYYVPFSWSVGYVVKELYESARG